MTLNRVYKAGTFSASMYKVKMKGNRKRRKSQFPRGHDTRRKHCKVEWHGDYSDITPHATRSHTRGDDSNLGPASTKTNDFNLDAGDDILDVYQVLNNEAGEKDTYRFIHAGKTCELFTQAFHEHSKQFPDCNCNFEFDWDREEKWGVCWKEAIVCTLCEYKSDLKALYKEVNTGKRGRKPAAPNMALQAALQDERCGNSAIRKILVTMNTGAPSESSMTKMSNTVGDMITKMTLKNLENLRMKLREEAERRQPGQNPGIPAEADGQYNIPLWSAPDRTPRQPATQATLTFCENFTEKKKIIGVTTENKLCKRGQYYQSKGENMQCPNHPGECSQTLSPEMPIGDEERRSHKLMTDILQSDQPINVHRLTTDSDSHCYRGVRRAMSTVGVDVEHQKDPGHLSRSQRKAIIKMNFTAKVFPGNTKANRSHYQKRFSIDLSKRCAAEHKSATRKYKGDADKLCKALQNTPLAIMDCYSGKCGDTCKQFSFVCKGTASNHWQRDYIPGGGLICLEIKWQ